MSRFLWSRIALGAMVCAGCQSPATPRNAVDIARSPPVRPISPPAPVTAGVRAIPTAAPRAEIASSVRGANAAGAGQVRLTSAEEDSVETAMPSESVWTGPLNLDTAIELGLTQNPDLVTLRQNEGVGEGMLEVAQTYPFNPYVQIQATPLQRAPDGGNGTVYHYVLLMQTVQLAHQQQYREDAGAATLNQIRWNIRQFELLNVAQTARVYLTALYQRGIRDLTRASAELNEQLLRISQSQLDAGQITSADTAIVRLDAQSTRQQAQLAEANYQTAMLDLRRQLYLPLETPLELTGDLWNFRWKPARSAALVQVQAGGLDADVNYGSDTDIVKRLADGRPDLMAARSDIGTAWANFKLANASRVPDLQIGPYYQRTFDGQTFYGFRAQMDMMVINSGRPLANQRAAEYHQRHTAWEQLQRRAELEAVAAVDRYERARRLVDAARVDVQESLPAELQRLEEQFLAQEVDVLRIFQARTSLIQNRRAFLDLLNELSQATAAVTAATALPPAVLVSPTADQGE